MRRLLSTAAMAVSLMTSLSATAFESGSTGTDGVFNPTADTQLTLPPSGILNFTDVTIPEGVTVTFAKNANNTPAYILASGDVTIDGTIRVDGGNGGPLGNGSRGIGGPGGFDGGHGGLRSAWGSVARQGESGQGPGGGAPGINSGESAKGGAFKTQGYAGAGTTYGEGHLRTLIGGSGGGGAGGSTNAIGNGGGGGAGAILIAASGTVSINGSIFANGGSGGSSSSGYGGPGSGGAVRIVATTIQGNGAITALEGASYPGGSVNEGWGQGRIRLEAQNMLRTASSKPAFSFHQPFPAFYSNLPSLRIASIGGETVPASPTGFQDVNFPGVTSNPITVNFATTNIPLGTTITLAVNPERGSQTRYTSSGVTGSEASGTATVDINLPNGNATLFAYTSYTIQLAQNEQDLYTQYAHGEQVEKVRVDVDTNGKSETTFITVTGNEYSWPSNAVALN